MTEIEYFCRYREQVERGKISNVVDAKSFHLAIAKVKYLRTWNFPHKCPPSTSSTWGKDFENWFNTFGDIGFWLVPGTGWTWQNFKCCRCENFSPCHWKSKITAHLKLSTQMPTLNILELRQRFRNRLNTLADIGFLLAQCTGWKLQNFKCFRCAKFSRCHWKRKIPAPLGIWVESFRGAGIFLFQWQRENFAHRKHLKFCNFQPVHCASKNPISPKVFSRFSKSLPQPQDVEGGHLGGKFQVRSYFTFPMARWKVCASTTSEILPLSTCTLCQKKSYISKGVHTIFEI